MTDRDLLVAHQTGEHLEVTLKPILKYQLIQEQQHPWCWCSQPGDQRDPQVLVDE